MLTSKHDSVICASRLREPSASEMKFGDDLWQQMKEFCNVL
jgi:hypothetical protein